MLWGEKDLKGLGRCRSSLFAHCVCPKLLHETQSFNLAPCRIISTPLGRPGGPWGQQNGHGAFWNWMIYDSGTSFQNPFAKLFGHPGQRTFCRACDPVFSCNYRFRFDTQIAGAREQWSRIESFVKKQICAEVVFNYSGRSFMCFRMPRHHFFCCALKTTVDTLNRFQGELDSKETAR